MIKVGLNIGNSKISCAVSEITENKKIKLLSFQSFPSNILKNQLFEFPANNNISPVFKLYLLIIDNTYNIYF